MASSNPTTGIGVAAVVQLTGTNLTNMASGGLTVATEATANDTTGLNGQGFGAVGNIANRANAQYALQLSLSGKTIGGTVYASTCQLTVVLKDVAGTTYTPVGSPVYVSYGDPNNAAGSPPSWYKPSALSGYTAEIVSVSSSGLITSRALGQSVVEVAFPTFDNTLGVGPSDINMAEPIMNIYAQVLVTVV